MTKIMGGIKLWEINRCIIIQYFEVITLYFRTMMTNF